MAMQDSFLVEKAFSAQENLPAPVYQPPTGKINQFKDLDDAISGADDFDTILYYMQEQTHKGDPRNLITVGTGPSAASSSTTSLSIASSTGGNSSTSTDDLLNEDNKFKRLAAEIRNGKAIKTKRKRAIKNEYNSDSDTSSSDSEGHPGYRVPGSSNNGTVNGNKRHRNQMTALQNNNNNLKALPPSEPLSMNMMDTPNATPNSIFDKSPGSSKLSSGGNQLSALEAASPPSGASNSDMLSLADKPWPHEIQERKAYDRQLKVVANKNELKRSAVPDVIIDYRTPTRLEELLDLAREKKVPNPKLTIVVPARKNSTLNLLNAIEFLANNQYYKLTREDRMKWANRKTLVFDRDILGYNFHVQIVDSVTSIEDWRTVGAVFVDQSEGGEDWQFLDWPFVSHVHLFAAIRGYYIHYRGTPIKSQIMNKCDVKKLEIEEFARHQDYQVALQFWDDVTTFLQRRSSMNFLQNKIQLKNYLPSKKNKQLALTDPNSKNGTMIKNNQAAIQIPIISTVTHPDHIWSQQEGINYNFKKQNTWQEIQAKQGEEGGNLYDIKEKARQQREKRFEEAQREKRLEEYDWMAPSSVADGWQWSTEQHVAPEQATPYTGESLGVEDAPKPGSEHREVRVDANMNEKIYDNKLQKYVGYVRADGNWCIEDPQAAWEDKQVEKGKGSGKGSKSAYSNDASAGKGKGSYDGSQTNQYGQQSASWGSYSNNYNQNWSQQNGSSSSSGNNNNNQSWGNNTNDNNQSWGYNNNSSSWNQSGTPSPGQNQSWGQGATPGGWNNGSWSSSSSSKGEGKGGKSTMGGKSREDKIKARNVSEYFVTQHMQQNPNVTSEEIQSKLHEANVPIELIEHALYHIGKGGKRYVIEGEDDVNVTGPDTDTTGTKDLSELYTASGEKRQSSAIRKSANSPPIAPTKVADPVPVDMDEL